MGFPSEKELSRARKKLSKVEPTHPLPKNASKSDNFHYDSSTQKLTAKACSEIVQRLQ